jgi:hypothetical protein
LVARFKQIDKMKPYVPSRSEDFSYPLLRTRADKADPVGHHRQELRPDNEVRHCDPARNRLTDADRRGLTPLFHSNMTPYREIQLRTDRRLDIAGLPATCP